MKLSRIFFALALVCLAASAFAPHQLLLAELMAIAFVTAKANEKPKQ